MKIAFLLYPTAGTKVNEDSSFWIMHELARRGHEVTHFESRHLLGREGTAWAFLTRARLDSRRGYLPSPLSRRAADLSAWDCVFIRKEPPFDGDYLHALQLLELLRGKVFMINDPRGIAMAGEKLFILNFRNFIPETLVTQDREVARQFIRHLRRPVVLKPLGDKGGRGIVATSASDRNLPTLLEMATRGGRDKIMIQRFISAGRFGDKRLLVLAGRILGAFLRKPSPSDFRANLSVGGTMHRARVSAQDEKLVEKMAPCLSAHGLYFTGIDTIGGCLTEVNVTSPSGIPEIKHFTGKSVEKEIADFIEAGSPLGSR